MRRIWPAVVLCAASVAALPALGTSLKITRSLDLYFASGSAQMRGEELAKLEALVCEVGNHHAEVLIAVGHTAADEAADAAAAQALSERRSKAVAQWLQHQTAWPVYTEGKAASLPVADNLLPVGRALNRRVEIELIGLASGPDKAASQCQPAWKTALLAGPTAAPVVAKVLVEQGFLWPQTPFLTALDAERGDIFDALVAQADRALAPEWREAIAFKALQKGRSDVFLHWVAQDAGAPSLAQGDRWLRNACTGAASTAERVRALDALREAGARVASADTMQCALSWQQEPSLEVLEALFRAGGQPYVDADMLVASGARPVVLERLLALGMNPRVANADGATLFHTVALDSPATVQRLLDWGLDINAKARVKGYRGQRSDQPVSPLHLAQGECRCGGTDVLAFMQAHGARVEEAGPLNLYASDSASQRWMVENGVPVSAPDLVYLASEDRNVPIFEAMLARGIDLDAADDQGRTALARAIELYQVAMVRFLVQVARVDLGPLRSRNGDNLPSALALAQQLTALVYPSVPIHGAVPDPMPEPTQSAERQAKKAAIIAIVQSAPARP